jgi:glucose/arabinose dehydrogenase
MPLVSKQRTVLLFLVFVIRSLTISALPVGFIDEGILSRDAIITGAFAPNPRNNNTPMLLLSTKTGQIYAMEDPDNSEANVLVADLQNLLCTNGERGLQSIEPHPNFAENQYLYLFYSRAVTDCPESATTGPPNRVSRFVVDRATLTIDLDTEVLIMQTSPSPRKIHNGGSMSFGVDGYLYITTGDGGMREPSYSQDTSNLFGSILRVDENGDAPASNPFTTASGGSGVPCGKSGTGLPPVGSPDNAVCEEIYAYGFRNPFRLTMDYDSVDRVLFSVGDVGASVWEEISYVIVSFVYGHAKRLHSANFAF